MNLEGWKYRKRFTLGAVQRYMYYDEKDRPYQMGAVLGNSTLLILSKRASPKNKAEFRIVGPDVSIFMLASDKDFEGKNDLVDDGPRRASSARRTMQCSSRINGSLWRRSACSRPPQPNSCRVRDNESAGSYAERVLGADDIRSLRGKGKKRQAWRKIQG
jgi:hypothetical protein